MLPLSWSGTTLRLITPLCSCAPVLLPWLIQSCLISAKYNTTTNFFFTPVFSGPPCSIWLTGLLKFSVLTFPSYYLRIQMDIHDRQLPACAAAEWVYMCAEKAQKSSFIWLILFLTQPCPLAGAALGWLSLLKSKPLSPRLDLPCWGDRWTWWWFELMTVGGRWGRWGWDERGGGSLEGR